MPGNYLEILKKGQVVAIIAASFTAANDWVNLIHGETGVPIDWRRRRKDGDIEIMALLTEENLPVLQSALTRFASRLQGSLVRRVIPCKSALAAAVAS